MRVEIEISDKEAERLRNTWGSHQLATNDVISNVMAARLAAALPIQVGDTVTSGYRTFVVLAIKGEWAWCQTNEPGLTYHTLALSALAAALEKDGHQ